MALLMNRRNFIKNVASVPFAAGIGLSSLESNAAFLSGGKEKSLIKVGSCVYSYRKYLRTYRGRGGGGEMNVDDFMKICSELGMDGIELTSYYIPQNPTKEYLMERKRKAFSLGLEISGTAAGNNFTQPDGWERHKQVTYVKNWIRWGALFGTPCIRVFGGHGIPDGYTEEDTHKWVVECLQECSEYGKKHGVVLVLENHGGFPQDAEQVIRILKDVNSIYCMANLDTGNFVKSPYDEIAMIAPYAGNCHIKVEIRGPNNTKVPADIPRIISILKNSGYKGFVSIEYESAEDPKTAVPKFFNQIKKALG